MAVFEPAATVTDPGTVATVCRLDVRLILSPLAPAAFERVTVPSAVVDPMIGFGTTFRVEICWPKPIPEARQAHRTGMSFLADRKFNRMSSMMVML